MARLSPQDVYTKWSQRVQGSQQYYVQGVQNSKDWAAGAVAAAPARDAGIQQAIADGRIDRGIQRKGTAGWRADTLAKGPQNWSAAVASPHTQAKFVAGFGRLYQQLDAAQQAISGIPRGGLAANIQRMTTFVQTVHDVARQQKLA